MPPNPLLHSEFSPPPSIWAIIPVKPLLNSKQRLSHLLTAAQRADLIHRFLARTLDVLTEVPTLAQTVVVSRDEAVLTTAVYMGATFLRESGPPGLNPAVAQALTHTRRRADAILILPADLPFLQPGDIHKLLHHWANSPQPEKTAVISPDKHRTGTNALLLPQPTRFQPGYGPNSFQHHQQELTRHHATQIITTPTLQFDLDTEPDWHTYQSTINHYPLTIYHSQGVSHVP